MKLSLKPGTLIVFEGLDKTGKSNQANTLSDASQRSPAVLHMPSGVDNMTRVVYRLLEDDTMPWSTEARQLLHLACHCEAQIHLQHLREMGAAIILDRWWWSTVAYGYKDTSLEGRFSFNQWADFCAAFWKGVEADIIFLFTEVYVTDNKNRQGVLEGYQDLATHGHGLGRSTSQGGARLVQVPRGEKWQIHEYIKAALVTYGIAELVA